MAPLHRGQKKKNTGHKPAPLSTELHRSRGNDPYAPFAPQQRSTETAEGGGNKIAPSPYGASSLLGQTTGGNGKRVDSPDLVSHLFFNKESGRALLASVNQNPPATDNAHPT